MDQVSDITYRADGKRLGDENLHNDFGEFRHYIVEKYAYNMANRFAGKEPSDVSILDNMIDSKICVSSTILISLVVAILRLSVCLVRHAASRTLKGETSVEIDDVSPGIHIQLLL
jgi:hypothetical protein